MIPKATVLMSVYNGQQYLQEAVNSILNQTLTDFEFIIVDDGSTDSTYDILVDYAEQDERISFVRNEKNIGLTRSLNRGLALARGEYIARQDADDISLPERLEKQTRLLDSQPDIVLVTGNFEIIDADGYHLQTRRLTGESDVIAWRLLFDNYLGAHSLVMFRREPVLSLGGYAEEYRFAQDFELWSRLTKVGDVAILPDVLLQWRAHNSAISETYVSEQTAYAVNAARRNILELTSIELDNSQLAELRQLWIGLPLNENHFKSLHHNLQRIYREFVWQRTQQHPDNARLSRRLRFLISSQLLYCARSQSWPDTLSLKLKVLPYALAWHPLAALLYWLRMPGKIVSRTIMER